MCLVILSKSRDLYNDGNLCFPILLCASRGKQEIWANVYETRESL